MWCQNTVLLCRIKPEDDLLSDRKLKLHVAHMLGAPAFQGFGSGAQLDVEHPKGVKIVAWKWRVPGRSDRVHVAVKTWPHVLEPKALEVRDSAVGPKK